MVRIPCSGEVRHGKGPVARADKEFHGKLLSRRPRYPAWGQWGLSGAAITLSRSNEIRRDLSSLRSIAEAATSGSRSRISFRTWLGVFRAGAGSRTVSQGPGASPFDKGGREYLKWLRIAQEFALMNRSIIAERILSFFGKGLDERSLVESVHNYISERDGIVRKGAISAHKERGWSSP
jgi:tRNA-splicing ligase RtcB